MRRNLIVFVLVMIAVLAVWFLLIYSPQSNKIDEAKAAADSAEEQARKLNLEVQRLQALEKQAPQRRERAARADTAIPEEPQLAQFILQVQEAANASGVDWISVAPAPPALAGAAPAQGAPVELQGVREVAISMNVEGGYFQVQDFITRIETLTRAVKVTAVVLAGGQEDATNLVAALSMKMFVSQPQAPPAPAPVPATSGG